MTRYTIEPNQLTSEQFQELYDVGTFVPRTYEWLEKAKPFRRPAKHIGHVISILRQEAEIHRDLDRTLNRSTWERRVEDMEAVANYLESLLPAPKPPKPPTRKQARARLYDLLTQDIYTDAPEYADRVAEVYELAAYALGFADHTLGVTK